MKRQLRAVKTMHGRRDKNVKERARCKFWSFFEDHRPPSSRRSASVRGKCSAGACRDLQTPPCSQNGRGFSVARGEHQYQAVDVQADRPGVRNWEVIVESRPSARHETHLEKNIVANVTEPLDSKFFSRSLCERVALAAPDLVGRLGYAKM